MKLVVICIIISFPVQVIAQGNENGIFNYKVLEVRGDLNMDNLADKVVVTQDTADDKSPYRLQVFFAKKNAGFKLFVSSVKNIEPLYPDGKEAGNNTTDKFSGVMIKKGILIVKHNLYMGYHEDKFRFQNESFELIGQTNLNENGHGGSTFIDFNLSNGVKETTRSGFEANGEGYDRKKEIKLIRPLPKLGEDK